MWDSKKNSEAGFQSEKAAVKIFNEIYTFLYFKNNMISCIMIQTKISNKSTFCNLLYTSLAIIIATGNTGCSEVSTDLNDYLLEGTYLVSGQQIDMQLCWPQDCGIRSRDTTNIEFHFEIRVPRNIHRKDTVQVIGLEGVNGENLYICYPRYNPTCSMAKYKNGTLEINIVEPGGHYSGTGKLDRGRITLETTYYRRAKRIDYILEGYIVGK